MKQEKPKNELNAYVKYSGLAFQMAFIIGGGLFGGYQIDKYFTLHFPVFTITITLAAVFLAIYIAIKDFLKK